MMDDLDALLAPFDYQLPPHLIAVAPAHPRDSAKLLVYDRATKQTSVLTFRSITDYLPKNAVLVFNETRVIPARMHLKKQTGGGIGALYLETVRATHASPLLRMMADGKFKAGDKLEWEDGHFFMVEERAGKEALFKPSFPLTDLHNLLRQHGHTPLPPYIKNSPLTEEQRRSEYQTVYAKTDGSVAAPTAGLHFTTGLLDAIRAHGCDIQTVTLHVGQGTFAPITEEHLRDKKLHEEWYEISGDTAAFLNKAKAEGRPIIAVGTTTVRTLESATQNGKLETLQGSTSIFITENDRIHFVDGLVTNFHVPKSSLLMLVSAFVGRETLLDLYKKAMDEEFRFFSFGDGMLIL